MRWLACDAQHYSRHRWLRKTTSIADQEHPATLPMPTQHHSRYCCPMHCSSQQPSSKRFALGFFSGLHCAQGSPHVKPHAALLTFRHTGFRHDHARCMAAQHNMNSAQLKMTQTGPPSPSLQPPGTATSALLHQAGACGCTHSVFLCSALAVHSSSRCAALTLLADHAAYAAASPLASSSRDTNLGPLDSSRSSSRPHRTAQGEAPAIRGHFVEWGV